MKPSTPTYPIAFAVAAAAASISISAHAEYRCASARQLSNAEKRACELAQRATPDALVHLVNRTKAIHGLDVLRPKQVER